AGHGGKISPSAVLCEVGRFGCGRVLDLGAPRDITDRRGLRTVLVVRGVCCAHVPLCRLGLPRGGLFGSDSPRTSLAGIGSHFVEAVGGASPRATRLVSMIVPFDDRSGQAGYRRMAITAFPRPAQASAPCKRSLPRWIRRA